MKIEIFDFVYFPVQMAWPANNHRKLMTYTKNTGVEMEALTAASVALLTIYDMCKAVDRGMVISNIRLLEKQGGKSGSWKAEQ